MEAAWRLRCGCPGYSEQPGSFSWNMRVQPLHLSAQARGAGELLTHHPAPPPMWDKLKLSQVKKLVGILEIRKSGFFDQFLGCILVTTPRTNLALTLLGVQTHCLPRPRAPHLQGQCQALGYR